MAAGAGWRPARRGRRRLPLRGGGDDLPQDVEARAAALRAAGAALAGAVPVRQPGGAARRHLREADRPGGGVLARRLPPGVRGRARPRRARQRDARRRGLRAASGRAHQGHRARRDGASGSRPRPRRPPRRACSTCRRCASSGRVFHGDRELERGRPRRSHEGQPRLRAPGHPRGPRPRRARRSPTGSTASRSSRSRRARSTLFWDTSPRRPAAWRARCAPTSPSSTPRSSWSAGGASTRDEGRAVARPARGPDRPAGRRWCSWGSA